MGRKISASDVGDGNYLDRLTAGLLRVKAARPVSPQKQSILILKLSVFVGLMVVSAVIGYVAYDVVRDSENKQFTQAYNTLIKEIIPSTNIGISGTVNAVDDMVSVLGDFFPNASSWPNVAYPGFTKMATTASILSGAAGFAFVPLVLPEQVKSFEDFAYDYYAQHPELYPPDVAKSDFGRGIYSYGYTNWSDFRYHDTTGIKPYGGDKLYLAPALQVTYPAQTQEEQNDGLMLNTRFNDVLCGNAHDRIIDCAAARSSPAEKCSMLTGLNALQEGADPYPRAYVLQPVFAADGDPNKVVGFTAAFILFNELLLDHIPAETNGIDYVINLNGEVLTYTIKAGKPVFKGLGDVHERQYDKHEKKVDIAEELTYVEHCDEMVYVISFYPTDEYVDEFKTNLRWVFCFGSVVIIMLVSVIFYCYDWAMMRESNEQRAVLDTKRQFVRFISHEVRTPLNAVSMASDLLHEQLAEVVATLAALAPATKPNTGRSPTPTTTGAIEHTLIDSLELCGEIVTNTKDAVEVLNDLLNYDKIEVGGLALDISFVAIEQILETVLKPFKGPAKKKDVVIVADTSHYLRNALVHCPNHDRLLALRVVGDRIRLEQVIRNLVSNALKFTSPMGKITVTLSWVKGGLEHHALPNEVRKHFLPAENVGLPMRLIERGASFLSISTTGHEHAQQHEHGGAASGLRATSEEKTVNMSGQRARPAASGNAHTTMEDQQLRMEILRRAFARVPINLLGCSRGGAVRLSVTDDGAGLTPKQLEEICAEGVQFNANELQAGQGSGLGLFIAKGIVKQHGGTLTVTSDGLGHGSTFVVDLPAFLCDIFTPEESEVLARTQSEPVPQSGWGLFSTAESSVVGVGAGSTMPSTGAPSTWSMTAPEGPPLTNRTSLDAAPDEQQVSGEFLRPTPTDFAMRSLTTTPPPPGVSAAAAPSDGVQAAVKPQLKRVLLVDDVTSNLKMATRLLMRGGVEVCEQAVDGQDAISKYLAARERVEQEARLTAQQQLLEGGGEVQTTGKESGTSAQLVEPFDAILMDFEMPVMNGPTATAKLREMGCTAPIIGITGNVLPQDVKLFLDSGAAAVLPKPLKFAELEALWRSGGDK